MSKAESKTTAADDATERVVTETLTEPTITTKTTAKKVKVQVETVVYIGPSIKNVVETGTIFNNGISSLLEKAIEAKPILKALVVSIDKLAEAKAELRTPGSTFYTLYKKAQE